MTITVTPGPGITVIGPGLPIQMSTTISPPYPSGTVWRLQIALQPLSVDPVVFYQGPASLAVVAFFVYAPPSTWSETFQAWNLTHGQGFNMDASLVSPTTVLDTGAASSTWDAISGIARLLKLMSGSGSSSAHTIDDVWNSVNRIFPGP